MYLSDDLSAVPTGMIKTSDFHYELPERLIAQSPSPNRDESKLLILDRSTGSVTHRRFSDLPEYLRPGDVLVLNDSKVIPARLWGNNQRTGGEFELLLVEENSPNDWWVMLRPGKRGRVGTRIALRPRAKGSPPLTAEIVEVNEAGHRRVRFTGVGNIINVLEQYGEAPLPPYIRRDAAGPSSEDLTRYQTVYARAPGSVAAPTAGLHFTTDGLEHLRARGVAIAKVTLHVGLGTFAPVKAETPAAHAMHEERFELGEEAAATIENARAAGGRVIAVGTTTVRVLETVAEQQAGKLAAGNSRTRIFVYPPREFQIVQGMITNFHLPCSTLLMLVSAFAAPGRTEGVQRVLDAYREAIRQEYRFFSYGDAMLLL
jgi:S-adenosylmethionine:tRNA ribosyltransferase-isomerase